MVNIFSFVLYGNNKKYTDGLLTNIQLINLKYPDWQIWIYYGSDVENHHLEKYKLCNNTKLIHVNTTGDILRSYRFFAIDDQSVDICIVRDADSRINDRDDACINAFIQSDRLFHIIRDHPNHNHRIMAGMWGIKRGAIAESIQQLFQNWVSLHNIDSWSDTYFLGHSVYPKIHKVALIHDDINRFGDEVIIPIPHNRDDKHFIGQVYEYSETGQEYPKFDYLRT